MRRRHSHHPAPKKHIRMFHLAEMAVPSAGASGARARDRVQQEPIRAPLHPAASATSGRFEHSLWPAVCRRPARKRGTPGTFSLRKPSDLERAPSSGSPETGTRRSGLEDRPFCTRLGRPRRKAGSTAAPGLSNCNARTGDEDRNRACPLEAWYLQVESCRTDPDNLDLCRPRFVLHCERTDEF